MYYPLSQITPNLHTNGNEYQIKSTGENYIGYYWKSSTGKIFTGKTPQDTIIQELIPFVPNASLGSTSDQIVDQYITYLDSEFDVNEYNNLKNVNTSKKVYLPNYTPTIPTDKDYKNGEFKRYFCKKTDELLYLEINKSTYDKLNKKDPTIAYQYYKSFSVIWKLTGDEKQVYIVNRNIVALTMKNFKLPQFDKYLKEDYVKYYQQA